MFGSNMLRKSVFSNLRTHETTHIKKKCLTCLRLPAPALPPLAPAPKPIYAGAQCVNFGAPLNVSSPRIAQCQQLALKYSIVHLCPFEANSDATPNKSHSKRPEKCA